MGSGTGGKCPPRSTVYNYHQLALTQATCYKSITVAILYWILNVEIEYLIQVEVGFLTSIIETFTVPYIHTQKGIDWYKIIWYKEHSLPCEVSHSTVSNRLMRISYRIRSFNIINTWYQNTSSSDLTLPFFPPDCKIILISTYCRVCVTVCISNFDLF